MQNTQNISRDLKILWALAPGPATKDYLKSLFFEKVSRQACNKSLDRLEKYGFVKKQLIKLSIRQSGKKPKHVLLLTNRGADEVANVFGIERGHIKCNLNKDEQLKHELITADVARVIRCESYETNGRYKVSYIYDDTVMKKLIPPKPGLYYPDLRVRIHPNANQPFNLNIEIDMGNKVRERFLKKMASLVNDFTLVIALTEERVTLLCEYVRTKGFRNAGFAVFGDFTKNKLVNTQWTWVTDKGLEKARLRI